jgi:predicted transcriptional regulator
MVKRIQKTSTRKNVVKNVAKARVTIANPFTQTFNGEESKSAVMFKMLTARGGVHVEDLAHAVDWNIPTVRVRMNQIKKMGYEIQKLGGYGDATYKLVG